MKRTALLLSVLFCGVSVVAVQAANEDHPLDTNFLVKASSGTHAMINLSKLADKHAASAKVKEFAAEMVKEHQGCFDKLAEIIKNHKVGVVTGFEKDYKAEMDRLSKLKGADFDKEYMEWAVQAHKKAIATLEAQIKEGKDADVTAFAKEALPKMKQHLKHAEEVAKEVGA